MCTENRTLSAQANSDQAAGNGYGRESGQPATPVEAATTARGEKDGEMPLTEMPAEKKSSSKNPARTEDTTGEGPSRAETHERKRSIAFRDFKAALEKIKTERAAAAKKNLEARGSVREVITAYAKKIRTMLGQGYTVSDIADAAALCGAHISAATVKRYLSAVKRINAKKRAAKEKTEFGEGSARNCTASTEAAGKKATAQEPANGDTPSPTAGTRPLHSTGADEGIKEESIPELHPSSDKPGLSDTVANTRKPSSSKLSHLAEPAGNSSITQGRHDTARAHDRTDEQEPLQAGGGTSLFGTASQGYGDLHDPI